MVKKKNPFTQYCFSVNINVYFDYVSLLLMYVLRLINIALQCSYIFFLVL